MKTHSLRHFTLTSGTLLGSPYFLLTVCCLQLPAQNNLLHFPPCLGLGYMGIDLQLPYSFINGPRGSTDVLSLRNETVTTRGDRGSSSPRSHRWTRSCSSPELLLTPGTLHLSHPSGTSPGTGYVSPRQNRDLCQAREQIA